MAKTAHYFITGVWFATTPHRHVSHVLLHEVNDDDSWNKGVKTDKDSVIALLDKNYVIKTKIWNYSQADWETGAAVGSERLSSGRYLRSNPDKTARDNIDNLIRLLAIV